MKKETVIEIEKDIKSFLNSPWNGILRNEKTIRILGLEDKNITFVPNNLIVFNVYRVSAEVSNFIPEGRLFEARPVDQIIKYDGDKSSMLFLRGLYIDGKNKMFLSFFEYKPGQKLPITTNFKLSKNDIEIL